jgi:hypothetical protein
MMTFERIRWIKAGISGVAILSTVGLFKVAGILPTTSSSIATWLIFLFCMIGLRQIYEVLLDLIAVIVDAKSRQLARRRRAV